MTMDPMMDVTPYTFSDQLVGDDLFDGPIVVRILSITEEPGADKPVIVEVDSIHPPWKPCKTSRRLMRRGWGKNMFKWIGKSVKLYRDPTVTYGTEEVGGVQIEQMSHMTETLVARLIVGRNNQKRTFTIPVLQIGPAPYHWPAPDQDWFESELNKLDIKADDFAEWFTKVKGSTPPSSKSRETLEAIIGKLTKADSPVLHEFRGWRGPVAANPETNPDTTQEKEVQ